jgi:HisJ family histidinol phosphate phosphatase
MALVQDHHIHTLHSGHSDPGMTVARVVEEAEARGLRRIVILEHLPRIRQRPAANGHRPPADLGHLEIIGREIREIRARTPVRILTGAEVDADPFRPDGRLLAHPPPGIDVVLASTHYVAGHDFYWYEAPAPPPDRRLGIFEDWLDWIMAVAANPLVNVLSHPGMEMASMGVIERFDEDPVLQGFERLLRVCAGHGTAFELNEGIIRRFTAAHMESYPRLLETARDTGVRFSVGSDAHAPEAVGVYDWVLRMAERLGLGPEHWYHPKARG